MPASTEVEGVRATLKTLREVDSKLARQAVADIKRPAQPALAALKSAAPAVPLSNMGNYGPVKVRAKYGGRRRGDTWPLVRIQLTAPGWTVASDMAMNSTPGESMVANLTAKYGTASRWVWPTVMRFEPSMVAAIKDAVRRVEKITSDALKAR
jgi:hypothetical protein